MSFYDLSVKLTEGELFSFEQLKDKVVLIVNTATGCGLAGQLNEMEEVHQKYKDRGLVVIAFPCNQFGNQEKGSNEEVCSILQTKYKASYLITEKIEVNGENTHPVYQFLKQEIKGFMSNNIKWNFTKFLVDSKGNVVERFAPTTSIQKVEEQIEKLLLN